MVRRLAAVWALGVLAACATTKAPVHEGEVAQRAPFRLGTGDVIEVTVYRDPDLTRTVPVRPDGKISLPIVGEVDAAGKEPEEVRKEIAQKLNAYVRDPTVVSLVVREVHSKRFYVVGEVAHAGMFPLQGSVNVLQALALAGGLGEFSARSNVTVVRASSSDRVTVALDDLWDGRSLVLMQPGDTLVVP